MKKIVLLLVGGAIVWLTGCETTKDISIREDGGGTVITTTDMSGMISLAKMSPKADDLKKMEEQSIDTTFSLSEVADSIPDLSGEERDLVRKGIFSLTMDVKKEKFLIKTQFPFTDPAQIVRLDRLSSKVVQQAVKKKMGEGAAEEGLPPGMAGGDGAPESSIDDYFTFTYSKGVIEKKLNKEKYVNVDSDEGLKGIKEMSGMGMGMGNSTIIIHLPAPAKKAEGKNLVLSDDKKTVTITSTTEDFFDDAKKLEYRIEY